MAEKVEATAVTPIGPRTGTHAGVRNVLPERINSLDQRQGDAPTPAAPPVR
jgi:hypothetical protein